MITKTKNNQNIGKTRKSRKGENLSDNSGYSDVEKQILDV